MDRPSLPIASLRRPEPDAEPEGADDLTELEAFNRLQATSRAFFEASASGEEVVEALDTLDLVLGGMFLHFFEMLPFEEATPDLQEIVEAVDGVHAPLRASTQALRAGLEEGDGEAVEAGLQVVRGHVRALCAASSRLRRLQEQRPRLSESPWADELVRVARLYLVGRLPLTSFQQRFERFSAWHRELEAGMAAMQPAPQERDEVDRFRPRLDSALRSQGEALADLTLFFEEHREARVEPALARILAAAEVLVEAQRAFQAASEAPPTIPCVRCGAENDASTRHCRTCNAVLIRSPLDSSPAGLDLMDSGQATGPRVIENVRRLEEAVAGAERGETEALRLLLEELEPRLAAGVDGLKRVTPPPPETPPDQVEIYQRARRGLEEGSHRMQEGFQILRQCLQSGDAGLMRAGLLAYREGAESAADIQALWEQLQAFRES